MPLVSGLEEDYNSYQSLDLDLNIFTSINISTEGKNPKLEMLKAELFLVPPTDYRQASRTGTTSRPQAQIKESSSLIEYTWSEPKENSLYLELSSKVKTVNDIVKITKKINFPLQSIPPELVQFTKASEKIDINHDIIKQASEIVEGESDLYMAVYKIADWVEQNIDYNLITMTAEADLPSSWVFENRFGVCDELTNLFISMLRSLNIPARFIGGVAYTNLNYEFGNHGWAEVYFPGYGWLPFDVTFGQFGWTDPSHIKFQETADSGNPSINYAWRSRDIKIIPNDLNIAATLDKASGKASPFVKIEIEPLKEKVGFGSYVPVRVNVKNLFNFYVPTSIIITKAPNLTSPNVRNIVLKPLESKNLYWITQIDDNLDANYIYTATFEAKTSRGALANSKIIYSAGDATYSKEWAEAKIDEFGERDEKTLFIDISLECKPKSEHYYEGDNVQIECNAKNTGNANLKSVRLCLEDQCYSEDLFITEDKGIHFNLTAKESKDVIATAETDNKIKSAAVQLNVIKIPKLMITDLNPTGIDYYSDEQAFTYILSSNTPSYNVTVFLDDAKLLSIANLSDDYEFNIPIIANKIEDNTIKVDVISYDAAGQEYITSWKFNLDIENVPLHRKIINFLFRIF